MIVIIFNIIAFFLDLLGTIVQYRNGNYLWSVILGFCTGMIFINTGWLISQEVEK